MIHLRNVPWTNPSDDDQRLHAVLHAVKAAGKLASILEAEGHGGKPGEPNASDQPKYAADLIISAIRLADVCGFDLEAAVLKRLADRNFRQVGAGDDEYVTLDSVLSQGRHEEESGVNMGEELK